MDPLGRGFGVFVLALCAGVTTMCRGALPGSTVGPATAGRLVTLRGVVLTRDENPVEDAEVGLCVERQEACVNSLSNHEGRFALQPVAAGKYWFFVKAEGFVETRSCLEVTSSFPMMVKLRRDGEPYFGFDGQSSERSDENCR